MKLIPLTRKVELSNKQESEFICVLESEIKKYFRIPIFLIMLFQIYNIVYVSVYTKFTYHTSSSKVYMFLYSTMFIASVLGLLILHKKNIKKGRLLRLQNYYIIFLIIWSLAVTIYDNRVSNNISVYIITLLSIAVLVYWPPRIFVPLYLLADIILVVGIKLISGSGSIGDYYGIYVNSSWLTIMALFISFYHFQSLRQTFLNHHIIIEKSAELDFIANHDSLTGLKNRRYLARCLSNIYQSNVVDQQATRVLIIDIDDFKIYNDYYGHVKGDECLKRVSDALNLCLSDGVLIRFGGEEFVCLLSGTKMDAIQEFGNELCHTIERLHLDMPPSSIRPYLTVSIGVAINIIKDESDWKKTLELADQALYEAKSDNKNKCIVSG